MNTDSSINVVVFEVRLRRRLQKLLGEAPTSAADGLRRVWHELAARIGLRPADVRRVYCQWEPTPDDLAFLAELPAALKLSWSFRRPAARRDWGEPTPEFGRAVDEVEQVGRRPWWQYWD